MIKIKKIEKISQMVELFETKITFFLEYYWTSSLAVSVRKEDIDTFVKNKDKPRVVESNNFPYHYGIDIYDNLHQIEKITKFC